MNGQYTKAMNEEKKVTKLRMYSFNRTESEHDDVCKPIPVVVE
jgi:hypothetical protein